MVAKSQEWWMAGLLLVEPVMSVPKWRFSLRGVTELGVGADDSTVARTGDGRGIGGA
jgi:hypothetical protein